MLLDRMYVCMFGYWFHILEAFVLSFNFLTKSIHVLFTYDSHINGYGHSNKITQTLYSERPNIQTFNCLLPLAVNELLRTLFAIYQKSECAFLQILKFAQQPHVITHIILNATISIFKNIYHITNM